MPGTCQSGLAAPLPTEQPTASVGHNVCWQLQLLFWEETSGGLAQMWPQATGACRSQNSRALRSTTRSQSCLLRTHQGRGRGCRSSEGSDLVPRAGLGTTFHVVSFLKGPRHMLIIACSSLNNQASASRQRGPVLFCLGSFTLDLGF